MDKNEFEDAKRAADAIGEHLTKMYKDIRIMRYDGYDYIPSLAYTAHRLEIAVEFLQLYERREEFQNELGEYNPADLDTMKYLFQLERYGLADEKQDQWITQEHSKGMIIKLDSVLPEIERIAGNARAAIDFIVPVARIYKAEYTIEKNDFYRETPEDRQKAEKQAEWLAIGRAAEFVHQYSEAVDAQIEVLSKLAAVSEKHIALSQRLDEMQSARQGNVYSSFMRVGEVIDTGFYVGSERLPRSFGNYMASLGLPSKTRDLLIENSAAGRYISSLIADLFEASADRKDGKATDKDVQEKQNTMRTEYEFVQERGLSQHQPKLGSYQAAKAAIEAIVDKMHEHLGKVQDAIISLTEVGPAVKRLQSGQSGEEKFRGGERTDPKARGGKWSDSV